MPLYGILTFFLIFQNKFTLSEVELYHFTFDVLHINPSALLIKGNKNSMCSKHLENWYYTPSTLRRELVTVTGEEIPVEEIERAGFLSVCCY